MPDTNIEIVPLQDHEAPSYIHTYCLAFQPPEADIIMPMVFHPTPLTDPAIQACYLSTFECPSPTNKLFFAKDPSTNTVLGISRWQLFSPDASISPDVHTQLAKAHANAPVSEAAAIPGMNLALANAYFETAFKAKHAVPRPFVELKMLAVHPEHQGKGVGAALVRDGLRWVDEMQVPALVIAAVQGRPLYERCGFDEVRDFPLDAREFGGYGEGKHWVMIRKART